MSAPRLNGLDEREAERRLAEYGPNIIQPERSRSTVQIILGTLHEPMFLFLIVAAAIYLVVGGLGEGIFLLIGAIVSIGLVVFQEARSENALAALRQLAEPYARVVRGGVERRIPARDLVPEDIILVGEGERLPVDGLLVAERPRAAWPFVVRFWLDVSDWGLKSALSSSSTAPRP